MGYVGECQANADISTVAVQNLPLELDKYFGVHRCSEAGKIPFAFVQAGGQTSFPMSISRYNLKATLEQPFNYRSDLPENDPETFATSTANLCMTRDLDLVENKPAEGSLIANCAMAMINTEKPLSYAHNNEEVSDLSQLSVFCVACKHGFKPLFNHRFPMHVYQCQEIPNCNTTEDQPFVNGCKQCSENHTFGFNNGIDYTQCVASPDTEQCLSLDSSGKCMFCKPGYSLNHLNKCEQLSGFQCNDSSASTYRKQKVEDLYFLERHYPSNPGCNQCA